MLNATTVRNSTLADNDPSLALIALLGQVLSFPGLREYAKIFLIGRALSYLQQSWSTIRDSIWSSFFIKASFEEGDDAYSWMMAWLAQHPASRRGRDLQVVARDYGATYPAIPVETDVSMNESWRKFSYLPSFSATQRLWYRGRHMSVSRIRETTSGYYGRQEESMVIRIMTTDHSTLTHLLLDAQNAYKASQKEEVTVYTSDNYNDWRRVASCPKRPLWSIILDPGLKEGLLDDAREFLESKNWYNRRGIPFRRNYLLYGPPGTGKTSTIQSLAGELGLNVYIVTLNKAGLDDSGLSSLIVDLPEKCIAIMEDIDAAFSGTLNREESKPTLEPANSISETPQGGTTPPPVPAPQTGSKVTLSGLLNAIDGIGAQEGRILFATTNKHHVLDPALCRPGRMYKHVEFKLASRLQAGELFRRFYAPGEGSESELESQGSEGTKETDSRRSEVSSCRKSRRQRAPQLNEAQMDSLASQFADAVPERELSMASLQGYLMEYKTQPHSAVTEISRWVNKEKGLGVAIG
ncbi:P-loop containing nucleoside triphosphate hydrolase protein [Heliocybe sulcata]|uniref:P-loop containing nucleoside triphosphate hydrolase protein n=1 Tax=Heliocybe sulcata TaxID=5364 RepID=A0A5C3MTR3_9AGAM|nr:P-loop containing nucleoside triphosphate hydrolase protein [Heliocybe sulcata]